MNFTILKSKRKTITITIDELGKVTIKAPLNTPNDYIYKFIKSKESWINKHLEKKANINSEFKEVLDKTKGLMFGKIVDFDGNFIKTCKKLANEYLPQRLNYLASIYGFNYNDFKIKNYKSRWGACDKNKNIYLNYKLIMINKHLIDYVILHELCHTKFFNHQDSFHNLLSSFYKNEKTIKNELKKFSFINKIEY